MKLFLFLFFLPFSFFYANPVKLASESEYVFQPFTEEGYFQGWNYSFSNSEYQIFITGLVSNLGPNSLNNGVSISIESKKTGSFFLTKEYSQKDLKGNLDKYYIKLYNNEFEKIGNNFEIRINLEEIKLHLKYENVFPGMNLSRGKKTIMEGRFVRADIPFSYSKASGYMEWKNERIELSGIGGMEHLLTNHEVYKFSKRWEILRSISGDGVRFFTGGYHGKNDSEFFRRISIQDRSGKIIFDETVQKANPSSVQKEPFSGYFLPFKEQIYTSEDDSCSFLIEYKSGAGKINVLENISQILKFFVRLFFANPFIINFHVKVTADCPAHFPKGKEWTGIKSDYLINPK